METCEICKKELVPFSYRAAHGAGFICGPCEKQLKEGGGDKAPDSPAPSPPKGGGEDKEDGDDFSDALEGLLK